MSASPPVPRSLRRAQLCSREHAHRVANRLFETGTENVSIVRTGDPLQPLRVVRSADVIDRSAEIVIVTS